MKEKQIIKDFIRTKKGYEVDGFEVVNLIRDQWGLKFDWHLASAILDSMETTGEVIFIGFARGRIARYLVN